MDNFLLQAITNELDPALRSQRLGRIAQLNTTDVAFDFRLRDGRWLVASTDPARLALYLTTRQPKQLSEEYRTDTAFVSLVKKHLGNAKLTTLEKLGYDRVIRFEFEAEDETGQTKKRSLIVLLTGRGANLLLIESGRILARLRESNDAAADLDEYSEPAPPADKLDPFLCSAAQLYGLIAGSDGDIAMAAQKNFIGFSPAYARELAFRARTSDVELALRTLLGDLFESNPVPAIYSTPSIDELKREIGREEYSLTLSPIELLHLFALDKTGFSTVNEAADAYFTLIEERRRFVARKQKLTSQFSAKLKKQRTLAANLRRELAGCVKSETHQRWAELLLANLHQAVKINGKFTVTDFYDEAQSSLEIPAAEKATAKEAAEHYFKLARKARHGVEAIQARLPEIEADMTNLENKLATLAKITRSEELRAGFEVDSQPQPIRQEKPKTQPGKKPKEEKLSGMRRYRSTDGYEILIGRTDRDNDNLTVRIAKSYDLWFHAADYPGSHAVLRNPLRREVPWNSILEAAQLAAKFSQARENAKVAVNYCEKKFVTKPKGFAPGQVRLSSFKTVMVEPREAGEKL